jgi:zinc-finger protein CreA/MIG
MKDTLPRSNRWSSGYAWTSRQESIHPHPVGRVVDPGRLAHGRTRSHAQIHSHGAWVHPYHSPSGLGAHHHHQSFSRTNDSPSPLSSDSDSLSHLPQHSPSYSYASHSSQPHVAYPGQPVNGAFHTPSMSPFLGPLRTLNLHSAEPSRAPSPFQLPPATLADVPASPMEDHPHGRSRQSFGSPPRKSELRSRSAGDLTHVFTPSPVTISRLPYVNERGSTNIPTPQLSSGTSSIDSSPGSYAHSLVGAAHLPSSFPPEIGHAEALSNVSSRAPSPPPLPSSNPSTNLQMPPPQRERDAGHTHHHLAHSLRVAFGMTPIHAQGRGTSTVPGGTLVTLGNLARHESLATGIQAMSMPASRSSSPPIVLPPLKLNSSSPSSPTHYKRSVSLQDIDMEDANMLHKKNTNRGRVELPGFHEFEAATGTKDLKIN